MKKTVFIILIIFLVALTACSADEGITTYAVSFISNGGSDVPDIIVSGNSRFTLPTKPARVGYEFLGWFFDDETFKVQLTEDYFVKNPITENVKVYAKWNALPSGGEDPDDTTDPDVGTTTYTVTFDTDGGTVVNRITALKIDTAPATKKAGHMFRGWYEGSVEISFPLTVRRNAALKASWSEEKTYEKDGETTIIMGEYPQTVVSDAAIIAVLDTLTPVKGSLSLGGSGYVAHGGESYYKYTVSSLLSNAKFVSNDENIAAGETYYFKVEPVRWTTLHVSFDTAVLLSEKVLDVTSYGNLAWEQSTLGAKSENFLNAFSQANASVLKNGGKVYALAGDENYLTATNKMGYATDFAVAKELKVYDNGKSEWMLRSDGQKVYTMNENGSKRERNTTQYFGFRPTVSVEYYYTITFENWGKINAFYSESIPIPQPEIEENQTFLGYYAKEDFSGIPLSGNLTVTQDKFYYAKISQD